MWFLVIGVVLLVLKWLAVSPVAEWSWWWVLSPFALTAIWWWVADFTGYTRRKVVQKEEARQRARHNEGRKRLGLPPLKD